jgi:hypothetical protein
MITPIDNAGPTSAIHSIMISVLAGSDARQQTGEYRGTIKFYLRLGARRESLASQPHCFPLMLYCYAVIRIIKSPFPYAAPIPDQNISDAEYKMATKCFTSVDWTACIYNVVHTASHKCTCSLCRIAGARKAHYLSPPRLAECGVWGIGANRNLTNCVIFLVKEVSAGVNVIRIKFVIIALNSNSGRRKGL